LSEILGRLDELQRRQEVLEASISWVARILSKTIDLLGGTLPKGEKLKRMLMAEDLEDF
jgi:hypothetical protein